jgi:DNA adenine methylase
VSKTIKMKAPFPYFGNKRTVAELIWERFGNVKNYVEPFCGSASVLLLRPHWTPDGPRLVETINDTDWYITNFYRAVAQEPGAVAVYADWPMNEIDLRARHAWLLDRRKENLERLEQDPDWYDLKAAGWWLWAVAANCIPQGFLTENASLVVKGHNAQGIVAAFEQGYAHDLLALVSQRMRHVRVRVGDWRRCVQSKSMRGVSVASSTGVFLDPPYADTDASYATTAGPEREVWEWAVENGSDPTLRICVAGYEDGREVPEGWETVEWKGHGGYGRKAHKEGRANAARERLWFSPHCLKVPE